MRVSIIGRHIIIKWRIFRETAFKKSYFYDHINRNVRVVCSSGVDRLRVVGHDAVVVEDQVSRRNQTDAGHGPTLATRIASLQPACLVEIVIDECRSLQCC